MNEFIIWDGKYKLFLDENFIDTLEDNGIDYEDDNLYYGDEYYPLCIMDFIMGYDYEPHKDRLSKLFYIGLNDINNNKIYADCSIVEFKWSQDEHIIKGYFTFNLEFLQYEIIMLNIQKGQSCAYSPFKCKDFKIIDTIQENKLGLIKE